MHHGIVGGGVLGLTLALRLVQAGQRVSLFEAAPAFGGLAEGWQLADVHWDRYYHVIAGGDAAHLALLDELGLSPLVQWQRTRTNFFDGQTLRPLNHALDYLRLPTMGLIDKLRVAATIIHASRLTDLKPLEAQTAQAWLTRLSGPRGWAGLWRPLLRGKLGANADVASAAYIASVIRRFYGAREGAAKQECFGFVEGGSTPLVAALVERLRAAGATLHVGTAVTALRRVPEGGLMIEHAAGRAQCDRVLATCPTPLLAALCPDMSAADVQRLRSLRWQGIVCASLLLTRPLGGAYMTYITDERAPFTTVIEMSSLAGSARFGGRHLVYLPRYVPTDAADFERSDDELADGFISGVQRMFPDLRREQVLAWRIARARHVLAVPEVGHRDRVPAMATGVDGLFVVNSSQIVDAALSINDSVRLADASAARLLALA